MRVTQGIVNAAFHVVLTDITSRAMITIAVDGIVSNVLPHDTQRHMSCVGARSCTWARVTDVPDSREWQPTDPAVYGISRLSHVPRGD